MVANTTKTKKAKSRALQNIVAEDIRALTKLTDDDVAPAIMGTTGIDIRLSSRARAVFPYGIECKNQEKISIWSCIEQCERNATFEGLTPLLIVKRNRTEPYVVLKWKDFIRLLSPSKS